jgi:glycosylphosphatidylinositol transamidase
VYRLNTYPLIHLGTLHTLLTTIALTPLLTRFEHSHGTLTSLALFFGPLSSLPAGLYLLIERFLLRRNTTVAGASVWVFVLLGSEAIATWRVNPWFEFPGGARVPTWVGPLAGAVAASVLLSGVSLLGHLCAAAVGYLCMFFHTFYSFNNPLILWTDGLGYLRLLEPPGTILRWIESKLNLLGRLPHYVSMDQMTYGRYGVLPSSTPATPVVGTSAASTGGDSGIPLSFVGPGQRLG